MSVLYGKDDTEVYAEGTAAGLLPKIGDMDPLNRAAMFLVMHTEENRRPPEVSCKSAAVITPLDFLMGHPFSYWHQGYMRSRI